MAKMTGAADHAAPGGPPTRLDAALDSDRPDPPPDSLEAMYDQAVS